MSLQFLPNLCSFSTHFYIFFKSTSRTHQMRFREKKSADWHCHFFSMSGFNAAVAGCFFAIETVLRPNRAENSPPYTTAMIILASVISSTVSNVLLGTQSAFTVPSYDLKSAAGI